MFAVFFYGFAGLLVISALRVVTARNPVHAALFLVLAFFCASGLWMLLKAEFLSLAKLLVFPLDELKRLPAGGKGVILMGLDDKEKLSSAIAVGAEGASYSGSGRAGKPTELNLDAKTLKSFAGNRARKGHFVEPRLKDGKLKAN